MNNYNWKPTRLTRLLAVFFLFNNNRTTNKIDEEFYVSIIGKS